MATPILPKSLRRFGLCALLLAPATLVSLQGCTDLDLEPVSALTPNNTFRTQNEILSGLASAYASMRAPMWGYYNLSTITTDEQIVPTRGADWFDNGRWLQMHRQEWTPTSGVALDDANGTWNDLFAGISRANLVIQAIEQNAVEGQDGVVAELRALRAFYYYLLMDLFGGVPIVTEPVLAERERNSRAEVFAFIESELQDVRDVLPVTRPADEYGRFTRGAADAILANMYLNAQVFTGEVTASGLTPGQARWQDAINAADAVLNSNAYSLATDWRTNFSLENENSPENILVTRHVAQPGLGMTLQMRPLHYNQLAPAPWNGFAALAETYQSFDVDDTRRQAILEGPQNSFVDGAPVNNRQGQRLVYTVDIPDPTQAGEGTGTRVVKFPPLVGAPDGNHPNDFPWFRLAEMILIKAEALNELGQPAAAIPLINQIRARAFQPDEPLSLALTQAQVREAILNERRHEFIGEAKRRQDLIRFGQYTNAWFYKPASEPYKILMPIPQTQIQTNPLLQQNPGY